MTVQRLAALLMVAGSLLFAVFAGFAVAFGATDYTGQGVGGLWYYMVFLNVAFVAAAVACLRIVIQRSDDDTPRNGARYIVLLTSLLFAGLVVMTLSFGSTMLIFAGIAYAAGATLLAFGLKR